MDKITTIQIGRMLAMSMVGMSYEQIAEKSGISISTVGYHIGEEGGKHEWQDARDVSITSIAVGIGEVLAKQAVEQLQSILNE